MLPSFNAAKIILMENLMRKLNKFEIKSIHGGEGELNRSLSWLGNAVLVYDIIRGVPGFMENFNTAGMAQDTISMPCYGGAADTAICRMSRSPEGGYGSPGDGVVPGDALAGP